MPDFGELINKAKQMAGEHPDQVVTGVEKLEEFVGKETGGKFEGQIESAGHMIENFLGVHEGEGPKQQGEGPEQQKRG